LEKQRYQSKKALICVITIILFFICLIANILYQDFITGASEGLRTAENLATNYDIYQNNRKIATINDYDTFKKYVVDKYQDKIAVGDGEILFGDDVAVVEKYDVDATTGDDVTTYDKIINSVDFVVSAVQVVEVDSGKSYYVPNLKVWENSLDKIRESISTSDEANSLQLKSGTEYTTTEVDVEQVLDSTELVQEIMNENRLTYTIEEGDTLKSVAQKFGITVKELLLLNPQYEENTILIPKTQMNVTTPEYQNRFTKVSVLTRTEPVLYDIEYIDDDSLYTGEEEIITAGVDGEAVVQLSVKYDDMGAEIVLNKTIMMQTREPITQVVRRGTKEAPHVGTGNFIWPTTSHRTSTNFGDDFLFGSYRFHSGLDINEGLNANVHASDNGVVITSEYSSGYGNYIVIDHNNGYYTLYGHLNSAAIRVGQVVHQGEVIGYMGSTGLSTGVHVHFEIRVGGNTKAHAQNPRIYVGN